MRTIAEIVCTRSSNGTTMLRTMSGGGPLTLRPTGLSGRCRVHVVAGMFGLLGGDELELRVVLEPGTRLHVEGVAATLVLPSRTTAFSAMRLQVEVAEAARLTMLMPPAVVCARSQHTITTEATVATDAELVLRESVVRGRSGEAGGDVTQRNRLDVAGSPVLRQSLALTGAFGGPWSPRAVGSLLHISPDAKPMPSITAETSARHAWLALPCGAGHQFTALADDPLDVSVMLEAALGQLPR